MCFYALLTETSESSFCYQESDIEDKEVETLSNYVTQWFMIFRKKLDRFRMRCAITIRKNMDTVKGSCSATPCRSFSELGTEGVTLIEPVASVKGLVNSMK